MTINRSASRPLAALRLYFPLSTRARRTRFWHHLSAPALASHLLRVAAKAGIRQAMLHNISGGYLPGEKLSHAHVETMAMRHPQCLELLDSVATLRRFLAEHVDELVKVHAVLFQCELPLATGTFGPDARGREAAVP